MDAATRQLIVSIHHSTAKGAIAVTGGGTGAVSQLFSVPGASRTLLEVVVPYHEQALIEFLGRRPENFCSAATGQEMAARALARAGCIAPDEAVFGLGCTASLATDRTKKGEHRFHISFCTAQQRDSYSLLLKKGARDREGEEAVLDIVLLNVLATGAGLSERLVPPLLEGEEVQHTAESWVAPLEALLHGDIPCLCVETDGRLHAQAPLPRLILPGAFNPAHTGHRRLAEAAARLAGFAPAFELSVVNVDKPPLSLEEVRRRMQQFTWHAPLWLTRAPTFLEKARLFPGVFFAVGLDTAERIIAPRYYQDSEARMLEALQQIAVAGCRFLVAGRVDQARFRTLSELSLPASGRELFQAIPEADFRLDLSSTNLRRKHGTA